MMDWTDRHCRFFLRGFAPDTLLYTEMITTGAVLRGDREKLLRFDPEEHPVALQLGGSDPAALAESARIGAAAGYDEINLNCGCPSDRVHSGAFGACLMQRPRLVADCVAAMREAVTIPVTVKLRIGVVDSSELGDEGMSRRESARAAAARFGAAEAAALDDFVDGIVAAGCGAVIVHARKAVLGAWSPRDNREIPPLRYDVVYDLWDRIRPVPVVLNGGLRTVEKVNEMLEWGRWRDAGPRGLPSSHAALRAFARSRAARFAPADARADGRLRAPRDCARRTPELDHASHAGPVLRPGWSEGISPAPVRRRARCRGFAGPAARRRRGLRTPQRGGRLTSCVTRRGNSVQLSQKGPDCCATHLECMP
jgi:tRNA dihydrouridine synthase A